MQNQRLADVVATGEHKTVITATTIIDGVIQGQGDVTLAGNFSGNISIDGLLFITEEGSLKGEAVVENMIVEGRVDGKIRANAKIEIRSSGNVQGNIVCQKIAIAEGACMDGEIKTKKGKPLAPDYFEEKRKTLLPNKKEK